MKRFFHTVLLIWLTWGTDLSAQVDFPAGYNPLWLSRSENSSGSMPLGGGDVGLNVWVEEGELLFYISRSGTFDENNEMLKLGRIRVRLEPNPFAGESFRQELVLRNGCLELEGSGEGTRGEIRMWVDVHQPVVYLDARMDHPVRMMASFESWRTEDLEFRQGESFANSYKWGAPEGLLKHKDSIAFDGNSILFFHANKGETVYDVTLRQQVMEEAADQIPDPLSGLIFGGMLEGEGLAPSGRSSGRYLDTDFGAWSLSSRKAGKKHALRLILHTEQSGDAGSWKEALEKRAKDHRKSAEESALRSREWWNAFWERSFIVVDPDCTDPGNEAWQVGRNYNLFRYMLGCNARGEYPTKFNGGLFTFDPVFTDPGRPFTPDFRNWGGGTFTAQNQRLVYFPMLKSGDWDLMRPQFEFYRRILGAAEARSAVYWGHGGACYTEQIENFGLPNRSEYGLDRPDGYDPGLQYNAWLEYQWDTSLEFCLMILQARAYSGMDISGYMEMILSVLRFFDEHYQYLASQRGTKSLDQKGHLVLYPSSACETYKMAYNPTSLVAGLKRVTAEMLALPSELLSGEERSYLEGFATRIPDLEYREIDGKTMISPARSWERINNTEIPQLYPVFPYELFGTGRPGLDTARNTYLFDPEVQEFRNHISWKQYNIMAARLGLTEEAWHWTSLKLKDSGRRFPAFWGPGFDWVPDHNWGGSGMIGLQDMLLQVVGDRILLFPAWPEDLDVHFKLHAPGNTVVEARWSDGKAEILSVQPEYRRKDILIKEH